MLKLYDMDRINNEIHFRTQIFTLLTSNVHTTRVEMTSPLRNDTIT